MGTLLALVRTGGSPTRGARGVACFLTRHGSGCCYCCCCCGPTMTIWRQRDGGNSCSRVSREKRARAHRPESAQSTRAVRRKSLRRSSWPCTRGCARIAWPCCDPARCPTGACLWPVAPTCRPGLRDRRACSALETATPQRHAMQKKKKSRKNTG